MSTSSATITKILSLKHIAIILAALSILVASGSLLLGFDLDDFIQRVYIQGSEPLKERGLEQAKGDTTFIDAAQHYFTFFNPKIENHIRSMKEFGNVPWWFCDSAQLSFFRPLTSATHWLDFKIFADKPWLMHLHNLLWAAALIFVITLVYKRFFSTTATWLAGFAGFLYMIDFSRLRPATWIANRNALMATFFGFLVLLMHDKWRKNEGSIYGVLAPVFLALAVLSAEAGIGIVAFIVAYALFLDSGNILSRARSMVPAFMVVIVWRGFYSLLGYGAAQTRMYIDPVRDPVEFIFAFIERAPQLIAGHFIGFDDFTMSLSLSATTAVVAICIAIVMFLILQFWPLLRHDKLARFWAASMLFAVVPVCAYGVPQGRLLSFAAVAGYGLVAQFMLLSFGKDGSNYSSINCSRSLRKIVAVFFVFSLVIFQLIQWGAANTYVIAAASSGSVQPEKKWLNIGTEAEIEQKTVMVINAPDAFSFVYLPFVRDYFEIPLPERLRVLSSSVSPITITRVDDYSLRIRPDAGFLPDTTKPLPGTPKDLPARHFGHIMHKVSQGYRDERNPMKIGEKVVLSNMIVEITEITDLGLPAEAIFTFNKKLEDDSFKWIYWNWDNDTANPKAPITDYFRYKEFKLPAAGDSIRLSGPFS